MIYTEPAWAKLNLTLDILGKRPDGYHDLRMVMQSIDLHDSVSISVGGEAGVHVTSNLNFLPQDENNLTARASLRFFERAGLPSPSLAIDLKKHIPVCAGMAGGSSDGAAVLRILRRIYAPTMARESLEAIGTLVGSDVPYCIRGGTVKAEGRGEVLTDLPPLPPCCFVVCKPPFSISTPELFSRVQVRRLRCHPDTAGMCAALERGDLEGVARRVYNVFEDVLPRKYAQVFEIKSRMLEAGAMATSMTGSGPTVFGMFRDEATARDAADEIKKQFPSTFFAKNVGQAV